MIRNIVRIVTLVCAVTLFAGAAFAQGAGATSAQPDTSTKKSSKKAKSSTPKSQKVDINSATKEELAALPVIGDATAQKIIDGRPYRTKHDLVTKNILTQDQYDKVKDQLVAHGGMKKGAKKGAKSDDMKDMKKDDMKK
jgi:competence protein ComEA